MQVGVWAERLRPMALVSDAWDRKLRADHTRRVSKAMRALAGDMRAGKLPEHFVDDLTVFIGHETILPKSDKRGMADWREKLFAFMQRNGERTGAFFCVPTRQVVEVGTEIEI